MNEKDFELFRVYTLLCNTPARGNDLFGSQTYNDNVGVRSV
jgi:hypothetical protein